MNHITTTPPASQAPLLLEEGNLFPLLGQVSLIKHGSNSPPFQGGVDASEAQQTGWFIVYSEVQNAMKFIVKIILLFVGHIDKKVEN